MPPAAGLDPVDVLLLMAASENDSPKVEELLAAGANLNITDNKGKSPLELASKQEVKDLIEVRHSTLAVTDSGIAATHNLVSHGVCVCGGLQSLCCDRGQQLRTAGVARAIPTV